MPDDVLTGSNGSYQLLRRIGAGGMGVVHLALDGDGRTVAIKELHPALIDDETLRRLEREVVSMQQVESPYVAEFVDADVRGPRPFVATRYVQGRALDVTVRDRGPIPPGGLERLATRLAEALAAIHAAGIIHRDLKPSNVMLCDGDPIVIDFGIAQAADATRLTQTGYVVGTPGYVAPEVVNGEAAGSPADIFAWGATVAFAATGRAPFGSGPAEVVFYRVVNGQFDLHGVPDDLLPALRAALHRVPDARPPAAALPPLLSRAVPSPPARPSPPAHMVAPSPVGPSPVGPRAGGQPAGGQPAETPSQGGSPGGLPGGAAPALATAARTAVATRQGERARRLGLGWGALAVAGVAALTDVAPVFGVLVAFAALTWLAGRDRARSGSAAGPAFGRSAVLAVAALAAAALVAYLLESVLETIVTPHARDGTWTGVTSVPSGGLLAAFFALAVLLAVAVPRWHAAPRELARLTRPPAARYALAALCVILVVAALLVKDPLWWPIAVESGRTLGTALLLG